MMAGEPEVVHEIRPQLVPMCHEQIFCGPIGNGLLMKLAVNQFLLVMANGLTEAIHFADRNGLDRTHFEAVLNAGPMVSNVSRIKLAKLIAGDYSPQAAIADALNSTRLITDAALQPSAQCLSVVDHRSHAGSYKPAAARLSLSPTSLDQPHRRRRTLFNRVLRYADAL